MISVKPQNYNLLEVLPRYFGGTSDPRPVKAML
jgi:hypothetical protein